MPPDISAILTDTRRWARSRSDIRALALVGSYASGNARPDSDIDLVIVADAPDTYQTADWVQSAVGQRGVLGAQLEQFGNVWSMFVALAEGPEIEFTFAQRSWVRTDPPAAEVCRIVRGGIVILYDPHGELIALCDACGVRQWGQTRRV
jgi:nucleotidyltransferase-like protein